MHPRPASPTSTHFVSASSRSSLSASSRWAKPPPPAEPVPVYETVPLMHPMMRQSDIGASSTFQRWPNWVTPPDCSPAEPRPLPPPPPPPPIPAFGTPQPPAHPPPRRFRVPSASRPPPAPGDPLPAPKAVHDGDREVPFKRMPGQRRKRCALDADLADVGHDRRRPQPVAARSHSEYRPGSSISTARLSSRKRSHRMRA